MKTATFTSTLLHAGAAAGLYYGGVIGNAPSSPAPCCLDNAMPVVWEAPLSSSDGALAQIRGSASDRDPRVSAALRPRMTGRAVTPSPFTPDPHNKPPAYPEEAREGELEGHGTIRLYLTKDGSVERTELLTPLNPLFAREAEKVLRTWRFRGTLPAHIDVPLDFSLRAP